MKILSILAMLITPSAFANHAQLVTNVKKISSRNHRIIKFDADTYTERELRNVMKLQRQVRSILLGNVRGGSVNFKAVLKSVSFALDNQRVDMAKVYRHGFTLVGSPELVRLKDICMSSTTTWDREAKCMRDGLNAMSTEIKVSTFAAKDIIYRMCNKATTWRTISNCFEYTVNETKSPRIIKLVEMCGSMSSRVDRGKCYRAALR